MTVHVIADNASKIAAVQGMIEQKHVVTSEMLAGAEIKRKGIEAVLIAADVADVDNIAALKAVSSKLARIPKRIFLIDGKARIAIVQAYALGATDVLTSPVNAAHLLTKLAPPEAAVVLSGEGSRGSVEAASAGAASIASMAPSRSPPGATKKAISASFSAAVLLSARSAMTRSTPRATATPAAPC